MAYETRVTVAVIVILVAVSTAVVVGAAKRFSSFLSFSSRILIGTHADIATS